MSTMFTVFYYVVHVLLRKLIISKFIHEKNLHLIKQFWEDERVSDYCMYART